MEEHNEEGAVQERHPDPFCQYGQDNDGSESQVGSSTRSKSFCQVMWQDPRQQDGGAGQQ